VFDSSPNEAEHVRDFVLATLAKEDASDDRDIVPLVQDALLSSGRLWPRERVRALAGEISDDLFGLGPLERLMRDPGVTEIMVNGPGSIYIEREGRILPAGVSVESESKLVDIIRRVLGPLNLRLDETSPMVDARLDDGSRLNAVLPPLCLNGPALTIRRFRSEPFTSRELVRLGAMTADLCGFLEEAVKHRANILVSGGTSSGKTTLLNVLASFIPAGERLITIEDAAELKLDHPHVVSLESRPPNIEGTGEVTVRDLVRNALRMRPDRIIVGEVRGAEALDMLQAMNTGHPGSVSTAHANTPRDLLDRLETMVLMSGVHLDLKAVRRQIGSALDLVVHTRRSPGGNRVVDSVVSVSCGGENDYLVEELYRAGEVRAGGFAHPAGMSEAVS
jgi:pilus assembly protein CpaF